MTEQQIHSAANQVLFLIHEDIQHGLYCPNPSVQDEVDSLSSFADLYDFVDANEYLIQARPGSTWEEHERMSLEIDRLLRERPIVL